MEGFIGGVVRVGVGVGVWVVVGWEVLCGVLGGSVVGLFVFEGGVEGGELCSVLS